MASPVVSVLFPTIRPEQFRRSYDTIRGAAGKLPYEVIIVADFPKSVDDREVVWLQRPRKGPIEAIEHAVQSSLGTYLFVFNDESALDEQALEKLYAAAQQEPWALFSPLHLPNFNFSYYGLPFAAFPFVHIGVVSRLGGLFDTSYRGFYADPDLSMRAHAGGIPIRVVEDAALHHGNNMYALGHQENLSAYFAEDQRLFRSRWDHLGEFRDPV